MNYSIKELRDLTGMTQREFALRYQIPVSTLRKWEQGDASPAKYFVSLLAGSIPGTSEHLLRLEGKDGKIFYYDPIRQMVYDEQGNGIAVEEDLNEVKGANLAIWRICLNHFMRSVTSLTGTAIWIGMMISYGRGKGEIY